ncbi:Uncharacterised protein [Collinsella intestinalis]|nr:Uncharacterised protein [Collinsella intestinalis]
MEQGGKASVPNILLQEPKDINVWIVRDGATTDSGKIRITSRPVPSDYVYTETDVETVETLTQAMVAAIESEIAHAEAQIAAAKAQADEATQTANQAITQAQETHKIAEADIAENRQLRETLKAEEAKRATAETNRKAEETKRVEAEAARKSAEATRAAHESERTESFNTNLVSWNSKVDAACKKATDTASKAAQDAKTATDAAIAKTEEAANAAVAKAQAATDNATTAANKAEAAVSKLPLPLGNTLKGEVESTMASVRDAYPAPLVTTKVMGQSNQQQEPAPSPENPQEITNLNKAEIVTAGKNLLEIYSLPNQPDSGISASMENDKSVIVNGMTTKDNANLVLIDVRNKMVLPAGVYTLSIDSIGFPSDCNVFIRDKLGSWIMNCEVGHKKQTFSFDEPVEINECSARILTAGTKFSNARIAVQLEVGGNATGYTAPATKALTPIDLQGNELCSLPNGVKDEVVIDVDGNVSLIKRVTSALVTSGMIQSAEEHANGQKYVTVVLNNCVRGEKPNVMCSTYIPSVLTDSDKKIYIPSSTGAVITDSRFTDKETAANILTAMNLTIFYQLAEPQTIPLGKVELPALPEATSNVWNDGNIPANVYVQYLKDVNIAYTDLENQIKQITAALSVMDTPTVIPEMAWGTPAAI